MREEYELTPADKELATALGALRPARGGMDRDRLMFQAGRQSARRRCHIWQGAAGVLCVLLVCSAGLQLLPSEAPQAIGPPKGKPGRTIAVYAHPWTAPEYPPGEGSYLRTRDAVLRGGLDALPDDEFYAASPEPDDLPEARLIRSPRQDEAFRLPDILELLQLGDET